MYAPPPYKNRQTTWVVWPDQLITYVFTRDQLIDQLSIPITQMLYAQSAAQKNAHKYKVLRAGDVFATAALPVARRLAPQRLPPCAAFEEEVVGRRLRRLRRRPPQLYRYLKMTAISAGGHCTRGLPRMPFLRHI